MSHHTINTTKNLITHKHNSRRLKQSNNSKLYRTHGWCEVRLETSLPILIFAWATGRKWAVLWPDVHRSRPPSTSEHMSPGFFYHCPGWLDRVTNIFCHLSTQCVHRSSRFSSWYFLKVYKAAGGAVRCIWLLCINLLHIDWPRECFWPMRDSFKISPPPFLMLFSFRRMTLGNH